MYCILFIYLIIQSIAKNWQLYNLLWILSRGLHSGFRTQFLNALAGLGISSSRGMFIDACYAHCQTEMQETWLRTDSPVLGKMVWMLHSFSFPPFTSWRFNSFLMIENLFSQSIAKAVGDWYFDRSPFQKIDCAYPCNPTCHNRVFDSNVHSEV